MASGNNLNGKIALVTGGGSGIGRAVCQILARDGARVSVCDINLQGAQETLASLEQPGNHVALPMDVTDKESVRKALSATQEKLKGTPTLLVNSAGIGGRSPFLEMSEEVFMKVVDVNLKGTFLVSQLVCNAMIERGEAEGGSVVNIASLAGKNGLALNCQYAATKGGVIAFTKSIAKELAKAGIRANCILPGAIRTPMMAGIPEERIAEALRVNTLGRVGEPEEVAEMVVFLLTERSTYMTGACVEVTGGHYA